MLLKEKRPAEAVESLKKCVGEFSGDLPGHLLLCQALKNEGNFNDLLVAAKGLEAAAGADVSKPVRSSQALAKFYTGYALEKLGKQGEALAAYQEGHGLDPKGPNGYYAANLLYARGDSPRALEVLAGIPVDAAGEEAKAARSLRKEIESATSVGTSPAAG
jgi:tetratricopeptide (TPR) repeat protein